MKPMILAAAFLAMTTAACDTDVLSADRTETTSSVGTIREIDTANRRFIVRADGQILTLRATEAVRNFDQLEVGDRIRVEYEETIAVGMADPSDTGATEAMSAGIAAPEGAKPGAAEVEIVSMVVEFLSYDSRAKTATLRTQEGDILVVGVAREMRAFAKARQTGDRITIVFERAAAIYVEPAS